MTAEVNSNIRGGGTAVLVAKALPLDGSSALNWEPSDMWRYGANHCLDPESQGPRDDPQPRKRKVLLAREAG